MRIRVFLAAALAFGAEASAQSLRVSVDRVFGIGYAQSTASAEAMAAPGVPMKREETADGVSVSFLGQGFSGSVLPTSTVTSPGVGVPARLAVDYELTNHMTVGAAAYISYASFSGESGGGISTFGFGVAPRVGYALSLGDRVSLWPRAGFTFGYVRASPQRPSTTTWLETSLEVSLTQLTVNIEPTFVYMPASHFGLTAGLVVDIPLLGDAVSTTRRTIGSTTIESPSEGSLKVLFVGLQFGVMGRF